MAFTVAVNDLATLQKDLGEWLDYYNNERSHQGKICCGRTPMATLHNGKTIWKDNFLSKKALINQIMY